MRAIEVLDGLQGKSPLSLLAHHPLQQLVGLLLAQALAGDDGRLGRWALPVTIE